MGQEKFTEWEFWDKLDVVGEDQVRINLIKKIYGDHGAKRELVLEWLFRKEVAREQEVSAKHDEDILYNEEILSIKRSAAIEIRNYRIIAITAIIIAIIAAHEEIMWLISSVMPWFSN